MTDLELVFYYLDMFVNGTEGSVSLDQKSYIEKVFLWFGIDIYKPASLLINPGILNFRLLTPEIH